MKGPFGLKGERQRTQHVLYVLTVVGVVAVACCVYMLLHARLYQAKETRAFDKKAHTKQSEKRASSVPRSTTTAKPKGPVEGSAVARLEIPRLGLSSIVIEGVKALNLSVAPGHIPGTPLPGQAGNVGIAGHRDTFFRPLEFIRKNDTIKLTTPGGQEQYRVVSTEIVAPSHIQVLYPTGRDTLTLVTCYPFHYVGPAPKRFIVRAERFTGDPEAMSRTNPYSTPESLVNP